MLTINHEDIVEIKRILDERYVLQGDCDNIQAKFNGKLANDDKRIELLITQQKLNNWLTGTIAGGIIALLIKVYMGG